MNQSFEHDNRLKAHEVKIAGLERMVGKLTMELEFSRGVARTPARERALSASAKKNGGQLKATGGQRSRR